MPAPEREECEAIGLLEGWLLENGKTQAWLAHLLMIKPPSVSAWFSRISRPVQGLRDAIQALTSIPTTSWERQAEREQRARALARIEHRDEKPVDQEAATSKGSKGGSRG